MLTYFMKTLKSGPSSESPESARFTLVSGCGGAVMLKKESKPSFSSNPVAPVSPPPDESPHTRSTY